MFSSYIARLIDWLIAIFIVCTLMWFFITQPMFPVQNAGKLPQVNQANLRNHIINLQKLEASQQIMKDTLSTDSYIFSYFSRIGKPTKQSFVGMSGRYNNVSLLIGSKTAKRVVIGVQYAPPKGSDKQFWNASGVAALLEAARVFGANRDKLPVAVELVAYAAAGVAANGTLDLGSFHHAQAMKEKKVDLQFMLALRSVGFYSNEKRSQRYPFSFMKMIYPDKANFVSLSSRLEDFGIVRSVKKSFSRVPKLQVESVTGPENFPLVGGADHENYWLQDFAALQVSDLIEYRIPKGQKVNQSLNFPIMAQVVQGLYQVVVDSEKGQGGNAEDGVVSRFLESVTAIFK